MSSYVVATIVYFLKCFTVQKSKQVSKYSTKTVLAKERGVRVRNVFRNTHLRSLEHFRDNLKSFKGLSGNPMQSEKWRTFHEGQNVM